MINVYWEDSTHSIIRLDYADPINSWEEYDEAVAQANGMAQSVGQPVYIVHNAGNAKMPAGSPIPHLRKALIHNISNCRMVISVIEDLFARNMVSVTTKVLFRGTIKIVGSVSEAYYLIEQDQRTLSHLDWKRI